MKTGRSHKHARVRFAVHVPAAATNSQQYILVNKLLNSFAGVLAVSLPQDRCQLLSSPAISGPADMLPLVQKLHSTALAAQTYLLLKAMPYSAS